MPGILALFVLPIGLAACLGLGSGGDPVVLAVVGDVRAEAVADLVARRFEGGRKTIDLEPPARRAFVSQACGGDDELLALVTRLLEGAETEAPLAAKVEALVADAAAAGAPGEKIEPGALVGRYRVLDTHLAQATHVGIHGGLPELLRIHLAEPLVALDAEPASGLAQ